MSELMRAPAPSTMLRMVTLARFAGEDQLYQLRIQRDRGVEDFRDRTVLFGVAGHAGEVGFGEVRRLRAQGQRGLADAESRAVLLERDRGLGGELCRREARGLKLERQRHREASGMGGGDQLFGIGALLVLEAGLERIGRRIEDAGIC